MNGITVRPYRAGEISYSAYLQMRYYGRAYGFKDIFEYYLLSAMSQWMRAPQGGQLWVAVEVDTVIGSIAIVKAEEEGSAQLRWFIIDEACQGKGIGKLLMDTAMDFCREQGYKHVYLWTVQLLDAARHIYERYGFKPVEQVPNREWTDGLIYEERWDLYL